MRRPQLQDNATVFDFAFVILSVVGLLGLLVNAARREDDGQRVMRVRSDTPHPAE
jgi:hypothetical protein